MLSAGHGGTLTTIFLTRGAALSASLVVSSRPKPPDRFSEIPIQVLQIDA